MRATRLELLGGPLLLALLAASLGHATCSSPRMSFLRQDRAEPWIGSPEPVSTGTHWAPRGAPPAVEFRRVFRLPEAAGPLRLRIEALRGFELELNGRRVAERGFDAGDWRRPETLEIDAGLRTGENELVLRVRNPHGPPLLRLRAEAPGLAFGSGEEGWGARRSDGPWQQPAIADDARRPAAALAAPPLARSLRARGGLLAGLAAVSLLLALALRGGAAAAVRRHPERTAWIAVAALWLAVFAAKVVRLPPWAGFDGPDHLAYVSWILERGSLPLASDGAQMHHPPLFYLVSAGLLLATGTAPEAAGLALRLVPLGSGLVLVAVASALARRLFPGDGLRAAAATLAAGFLPLHLTMSAYLGNEPLHAALAALALLLAVGLLLAERASPAQVVALGALLGLAALTKVSSLLLLPLVVGFVALRHAVLDRRPLPGALAPAAGIALVAALACGWYFARNRLSLGRALVGNWDVPGNPIVWWQDPGFHTPGYYLRFGEVLQRPFFASFDSFWDGLYSTLWGDGLVGGVASWSFRHPLWDWELMASGYPLALPATGLLLFGLGALAVAALREPQPGRRLACALLASTVVVTLFAVLLMTLVLPAYSMTKAAYALSLGPVLALALADGFARLHGALDAPRRRWAQRALEAGSIWLLLVIGLSFLA